MVLNLYKDVLDVLKVKYKMIASTNKFEDRLDQTHVVPGSLSEIMIFIPETKKLFSPFYYWMPYGPPSSNCVNNDGIMYYTEGKYNSLTSNVYYDIVVVDSPSMDDNIVKTNSEISIDDDNGNRFCQ